MGVDVLGHVLLIGASVYLVNLGHEGHGGLVKDVGVVGHGEDRCHSNLKDPE